MPAPRTLQSGPLAAAALACALCALWSPSAAPHVELRRAAETPERVAELVARTRRLQVSSLCINSGVIAAVLRRRAV